MKQIYGITLAAAPGLPGAELFWKRRKQVQ